MYRKSWRQFWQSCANWVLVCGINLGFLEYHGYKLNPVLCLEIWMVIIGTMAAAWVDSISLEKPAPSIPYWHTESGLETKLNLSLIPRLLHGLGMKLRGLIPRLLNTRMVWEWGYYESLLEFTGILLLIILPRPCPAHFEFLPADAVSDRLAQRPGVLPREQLTQQQEDGNRLRGRLQQTDDATLPGGTWQKVAVEFLSFCETVKGIASLQLTDRSVQRDHEVGEIFTHG